MLSKEERETIRVAGASWVGDLTLTALLESIEELEEKLREAEIQIVYEQTRNANNVAQCADRLAKAEKLAEAVRRCDGPISYERNRRTLDAEAFDAAMRALSDFEAREVDATYCSCRGFKVHADTCPVSPDMSPEDIAEMNKREP